MMRGINTTVRRLRRKVFEEVAALGFKADADTLCDDMEAIPYALVNDETEQYRDSVYRAILSGLSTVYVPSLFSVSLSLV